MTVELVSDNCDKDLNFPPARIKDVHDNDRPPTGFYLNAHNFYCANRKRRRRDSSIRENVKYSTVPLMAGNLA